MFLFSLGREQGRIRDGDERENEGNECKVLGGPQVRFFLHFFVLSTNGMFSLLRMYTTWHHPHRLTTPTTVSHCS